MGCVILLVAVLCVAILSAGCTSDYGSGTGTAPTSSGVRASFAAVSMPVDLTNQDSPLSARFTGSSSVTNLSPGTRSVALVPFVRGFDAPMMIVSPDDDSGRIFMVDQTGIVKIIRPNGTVDSVPFLNIRDRMVQLSPSYDERGLLSIAFHPDFRKNGRLFVYYSAPLRSGAPAGWSCTNHLSEFSVPATSPDLADMSSERILLSVDKPYQNHNGGPILFGPDDGYLYLPLGDGGRADDTGIGHTLGTGNGQDLTTLLGKVIRIDVDNVSSGSSYAIPPDNPFASGTNAAPEIFAFGFRNPAYASFDSGDSHHLFVASAGQNLFESVLIVLKGGNYGWNIREGTHCFDPNNDRVPPAGGCPVTGLAGEPLIGPVVELGHDLGNTVIGGAVYRGRALSGWEGSYVFGTWSTTSFTSGDGTLLVATPPPGFEPGSLPSSAASLTPSQNPMWLTQRVTVAGSNNGQANAFIRAINEGPDHELYLLINHSTGPGTTPGTGEILKIVPA